MKCLPSILATIPLIFMGGGRTTYGIYQAARSRPRRSEEHSGLSEGQA